MKKKEYTAEYAERFSKYYDELKWLYCELYEDGMPHFEQLCERLYDYYQTRRGSLKKKDEERRQDPGWYKGNRLLGMVLYVDAFAKDLKGVKEKLDYIQSCGVNYLHLMPLLDSPEGRSDGGYAVADFHKVNPKLGTMWDLEDLILECHRRDINVCLDFVMNHTSEDHEWARLAKMGDREYQSRYFFYDNYDIPAQYEQTVPEVFPTTAPGNFTWNEETKKYVMTTFYPYQWDLNYRSPCVFNEMVCNMLYLVNRGVDVIRIDAVPYIWKELGTNCRNLPQVHNIVRMMRIVCEIVCPGVLLLGEVVMEPAKVVPYFGTVEKPECHMLYNVTTMATTWHTVATRDTRLLRHQLDIVNALPREYVFLNYLRCHDDIGWGLDYAKLREYGMEEIPHKKYLNDYFLGNAGESPSRGALYNDDPVSMDARFCGMTASMCGIEKAGFEQDEKAMEQAIRLHLTLHAYLFMQSGIPVIYSGDEIGKTNDYSYREDPLKADDSRYIHRGAFHWELAAQAEDESTVEGKIHRGLKRLEKIRKSHRAFVSGADCWTFETGDQAVLGIGRYSEGEQVVGLFNFSEREVRLSGIEIEGAYEDLLSAKPLAAEVTLPPCGFIWANRTDI